MNRSSATVTLLAVATLPVMGGAAIAPALPSIAAHFAGVAHADLLTKLVLTLPALAAAVTAPLAGRWVDRAGPRQVLLAGLALFLLAGMLGAAMPGLPSLLATRWGLGMAVGMLMAALLVAVAQSFEGPARGRFMGWQGTAMSAGGLLFIASGGVLADLSWRAAFAVYLIAVPVLWAVWRWQGPGPASASPAARQADLNSSGTPAAQAWAVYAAAFIGIALFYLIPVQSPFLLAERGASRASLMGLGVMAATLAGALAALSFGRAQERLGPQSTLAVATLTMAAGYGLVASTTTITAGIVGFGIAGIGTGWLMPSLNAWLVRITPAASQGRASGWLATAIAAGQFASPLLSQPVVASLGLPSAFGVAAVALVLLALALWAPRRAPSSTLARQERLVSGKV